MFERNYNKITISILPGQIASIKLSENKSLRILIYLLYKKYK